MYLSGKVTFSFFNDCGQGLFKNTNQMETLVSFSLSQPLKYLPEFNGLPQVSLSTSLEERQKIASACKILLLPGKLASERQAIMNFGNFNGWIILLSLLSERCGGLNFQSEELCFSKCFEEGASHGRLFSQKVFYKEQNKTPKALTSSNNNRTVCQEDRNAN